MLQKIQSGTIPFATITHLLAAKKTTEAYISGVAVTKKRTDIPYCIAPRPTTVDTLAGDGMHDPVQPSTQSIGVLAIRRQVR